MLRFENLRELLFYKLKNKSNKEPIWTQFDPYEYIDKDTLYKICHTCTGICALSNVLENMFKKSFMFDDIPNLIDFNDPSLYCFSHDLIYSGSTSESAKYMNSNFEELGFTPAANDDLAVSNHNNNLADIGEFEEFYLKMAVANADKLICQSYIINSQLNFNIVIPNYDEVERRSFNFLVKIGQHILSNIISECDTKDKWIYI